MDTEIQEKEESRSMAKGKCEECGSTELTPVWEDVEDFKDGLEPNYLGCRSCGNWEEL